MSLERPDLSKAELDRYSRHLMLPSFGVEGQLKLKRSKVLVVGAGGLGSPVLLYLTAAGIGTIGVVDFDLVKLSNLQRQILHGEKDIDGKKTRSAFDSLSRLNSYVKIVIHDDRLTTENVFEIIAAYDVIVDASDNFSTRYLINDACVLTGKPDVYGSIFQFEGQVSVFNYTDKAGRTGPNYRDLFPLPPPSGLIQDCGEGGVVGALAGIAGSIQALEAIKIITGIGQVLSGHVLTIDSLHHRYENFEFGKSDAGSNIRELIDYEQFCNPKQDVKNARQVSAFQLQTMIEKGEAFQLIDVREPFEYELVNIGGQLMSFETLQSHLEVISPHEMVIVHCKHGSRSEKIINELELKFGFQNLYNLSGGIIEYIKQFRPELPAY